MILSAAMMLDWLGETRGSQAARDAALAIEHAVDRAFGTIHLQTHDAGGTATTHHVATTIADTLRAGQNDPPS